MAFLFPGKTRPGMPGGTTGIQPPFEPGELEKMRRAESWLAELPAGTRERQARIGRMAEATRAKEEAWEAEKYERGIRARPHHEFMPPGAAREAAEARAAPAGERGRRAGAAARRRSAASVGRVLTGRGPGEISRFGITEKPSLIEGMDERLAAYRKRERERKATARAGKRSVLRGRGRYGTRRSA